MGPIELCSSSGLPRVYVLPLKTNDLTGQIEQAVPDPKISDKSPDSIPVHTSSIVRASSRIGIPSALQSYITLSRVTPGRMVPLSGAV